MTDTTTFTNRTIKDLIDAVDKTPVYHDPYRWSTKPRKADRILDVPGPTVAEAEP